METNNKYIKCNKIVHLADCLWRYRSDEMIKRTVLFVIPLLIALTTLFPPFLLRGNRRWGFLFDPPVSISEKYFVKTAVGKIDWSILFAEYILAIAVGLIIAYVWEATQDKK